MRIHAETTRNLLAALAKLPPTPPEPVAWLARADRPWLRFAGPHVTDTEEDGCSVELDAERLMTGRSQSIRIENLGQDAVTVRLPTLHGALRASLSNGEANIRLERGGGSTDLYFEIVAASGEEVPEVLALVAEGDDSRTFSVRLRWNQEVRLGRFDFNGLLAPQRFDFGDVDPRADEPATRYRLRVSSLTTEPLRIRLKDLPSWLALETAGLRRPGPLPGTFFDRPTPVDLTLYPPSLDALGPLRAVVRLETDDMRGAMQHFDLELAARFGSRRPRLRVVGVPALQVMRGGEYPLRLDLENFGTVPARLSVADTSPGIGHNQHTPEVPAACSEPGRAVLELVVNTVELEHGTHERFCEIAVEEGDPARLRIPLRISVRNVTWQHEIDFGRLEAGRPKQVVFLAQADGAPLHPIAEPAPEAEKFLTIRVVDGQRVQVICKPPAKCPPGSYDLRVRLRQPKLFFDGDVAVRVRVVSTTHRLLGWAAAALLLLVILVVTFFLAFGAPSEMDSKVSSPKPHGLEIVTI
jgi:hypothetical protein